jgi:TPR repeat protein
MPRSGCYLHSKLCHLVRLVISVFVLLLAVPVVADDLNKGFTALADGRPDEAVRYWTPLAEQGDKVAQASLGLLYQTGQGVAQDHHRAIALFRASAQQGYPFAFTALGASYHDGLGVTIDKPAAMMWFLLGAPFDPNASFMAQALADELPYTVVQIVRKKAKTCQNSNYQKCIFLIDPGN